MLRRKRNRGFVLLLVVTMLAVVCLIFYQLSNVSLDYVRRVNRQEQELRKRWTVATIRGCVLSEAATQFSRRELELNVQQVTGNEEARYVDELEFEVYLNGKDVACIVSDESARLSVPLLLSQKPVPEAKAIINRLQSGTALRLKSFESSQLGSPPFSWRRVFEIDRDTLSVVPEATKNLTLWGDGRLNIYRADERTLVEAWRARFGHLPPTEVLELRAKYPPVEWEKIRSLLDLRRGQMDLADTSFSASSNCFSLRIQAAGRNKSIERYYFICDRTIQHFGFKE